jgi:ComF family protein
MGCRSGAQHFEANFSLYLYQANAAAQCLSAYKSGGRRLLSGFFAERLLSVYREKHEGLPLVPVPARRESLKKRGFDQIQLICHEMKKRGGPDFLPLLRRSKKTREQKTLSKEERKKNLTGSIFPALRLPPALPEDVLLVDDVFTTGATANACAEALKNMGVKKVYVLTIALD